MVGGEALKVAVFKKRLGTSVPRNDDTEIVLDTLYW